MRVQGIVSRILVLKSVSVVSVSVVSVSVSVSVGCKLYIYVTIYPSPERFLPLSHGVFILLVKDICYT